MFLSLMILSEFGENCLTVGEYKSLNLYSNQFTSILFTSKLKSVKITWLELCFYGCANPHWKHLI